MQINKPRALLVTPAGYVVQLREVDADGIVTVVVHHGPREGVVFKCHTLDLQPYQVPR